VRESSQEHYQPRLEKALRVLANGGVIAYPTEGVYGIGCLPENQATVLRLLAIKRRAANKGLILIASALNQLETLIVLPEGERLVEIKSSWPGPVTWILPAQHGLPSWLLGPNDTLAVRVTDHPIAARLCTRLGSPLISTSANRAGRPPPTSAMQVRRNLGKQLDDVLVGPLGSLKRPTTIRDALTGRQLR
jgi:L-threonylcarbamoyladenylate synthase